MPTGYLAVVLHAHLPYVRHPEHERFLEELWFYEGMAETYIPLLRMFSHLEDDGVGYRLLLGLSPTLTSMMEDDLLQERFVRYLERTISLAEREAGRHPATSEPSRLAAFYVDYYRDILFWFEEKCARRLVPAFRNLAGYGHLEIMTCGASHGFLPILQANPGAVRAQLTTARQEHHRLFGNHPDGIWIPECAYYPGLDQELARAGFHYSFVDSHALANASEVSPRGVYAPVVSPAGVAFFGRDWETGHQVWSAEEGYPGHPDYREFYRDLGFELPVEELAEFIIDNHIRVNTGLKYRRITSRKGEEKAFYNPAAAREQAAHDAAHFLANRQRQVTRLAGEYPGRPPLVVALYDAELFGHWWFEGPQFLDYMLRKMHYDQDTVKTLSPADYLRLYPENPASEPAGSSWGGDGTYEFWVNASNRGLVSQLQQAADRLSQIVEAPPARNTAERKRVLRQMFRELLLAQASDWPFIMRTGTSPAYAEKRVTDHLQRFWALEEMLGSELGEKAERELSLLEALDAVFPDCDPSLYIRGKIPQFS